MKDEDTKTASSKIYSSEEKMAQAVNSLLEPFKMRLYPFSYGWQITTLDGKFAVMYWRDNTVKFAETFLSGKIGLDRMLKIIKTTERWTFGDFAKTIEYNPYFGCKTLEEMLIKRDLVV